jgi:ABC-type transporter Mla maintaining outer membrane lipid asymmetry ATPase subunit MlaF
VTKATAMPFWRASACCFRAARCLIQPAGVGKRGLPPDARAGRKRPKAEAREIAIEKLRRVGLARGGRPFPGELSGGMQKRVGLARAIAAEPEIIFFDEPTTGLDPIMSGVINDLIREIVTEMGATAMTITHDMSSVRAIADNVAMLHGGQDPLDRPCFGNG